MALFVNVLALVLVVGISWVGVRWLGHRMHRRALTSSEAHAWMIAPVEIGPPCVACDGVGARHRLGGIEPCPVCEGTGEASIQSL